MAGTDPGKHWWIRCSSGSRTTQTPALRDPIRREEQDQLLALPSILRQSAGDVSDATGDGKGTGGVDHSL